MRLTGSDGRFSFGNVRPGATYQLVATSPPSFIPAHYGQRNPNAPGRPIALAAGQRLEVRIPLTAAGSVSGRVLDSDGKPVREAIVLPVAAEYNGDARVLNRLLHFGPTASTNSQGEYRLAGLLPGVYYLVIARRPLRPFSREPEIPTFFPATVDEEKARPIHLEPGANLAGINIPLVKTKLRSLRGVVLDEPTGKAIKATRIIAIARNADRMGPRPTGFDADRIIVRIRPTASRSLFRHGDCGEHGRAQIGVRHCRPHREGSQRCPDCCHVGQGGVRALKVRGKVRQSG